VELVEIIAEVGLAHDGSLSQAHAYVDACAKAGVDTVKFQCHLGDPCTEWRLEPHWPQDVSRQAYWQRTGFRRDEWDDLMRHCHAAGVEFLCSPFSVAAVALIDPLVKRWKVPSGRIADMALLEAIGKTGKPVLLSTGMGKTQEIYSAESLLLKHGCTVDILQCTSEYPCVPRRIGLGEISSECWDGLSDHSGTIYPGLAAAALGCKVLEVHVCWSKEQGGFDTAASLTIPELTQLVAGVRFIEKAMQPVDKDAQAEKLAETRRVFMTPKADIQEAVDAVFKRTPQEVAVVALAAKMVEPL
jgi:N,N'-diacetyllegionaminate synthase